MGDAWEGSAEIVRSFCDDYLADRVKTAAGAVEADMPARIFLDSLRELISTEQVLLEGLSGAIDHDRRDQDRLVGRMINEKPLRHGDRSVTLSKRVIHLESLVGISIPRAVAKVQAFLQQQGKAKLEVRDATLIQQLAALGFLYHNDGKPLDGDAPGEKSCTMRLSGKNARMVSLHAIALVDPDAIDEAPLTSSVVAASERGLTNVIPSPCQIASPGMVGAAGVALREPRGCDPAVLTWRPSTDLLRPAPRCSGP